MPEQEAKQAKVVPVVAAVLVVLAVAAVLIAVPAARAWYFAVPVKLESWFSAMASFVIGLF